MAKAKTWKQVNIIAEVEKLLKKHTQVKVPLPSKKRSVSRVKLLVQKTTWVRVKE